MKTPIFDFVKNYTKRNYTRAHMPGHKGRRGVEKFDITEISGADILYSENGIIAESENCATKLFGTAKTIYSAEGSTLAIKAMLGTIREISSQKPLVLAARNVHKAFVNACALLDIDVEFIFGETTGLIDCEITPEVLENAIENFQQKPDAVYVTSPDYLGNIADIKGLASVCNKYNIPLLVDNAHGAYLRFMEKDLHPITLGAAMCADSAHKTLPVITGGAYLHISKNYQALIPAAYKYMQIFASTSPSYLILQSLDLVNAIIGKDYFKTAVNRVAKLKKTLEKSGFTLVGKEPLKITVDSSKIGYSGEETAAILRNEKIEPEYADNRFLTLMLSSENSQKDFKKIKKAFLKIEKKEPLVLEEFSAVIPKRAMSLREAVLSKSETVEAKNSVGRVCAECTVSCPPAVPIAVSGEIITNDMVKQFAEYKIEKIRVIKDVK